MRSLNPALRAGEDNRIFLPVLRVLRGGMAISQTVLACNARTARRTAHAIDLYIHCTAAIRVGAIWLIRRVVRDGWTWDKALAEARKVGLVNAPHLEEFAKRYVAAHP